MFSCFFSSRQPHQCNCSSKVTGFGPATLPAFPSPQGLGLLLPARREQPLHLPLLLPAPWLKQDWFRDLSFMEREGERHFLAGAKVQLLAGGVRRGVRARGYFLLVCCLRACSCGQAPGGLGPAPMEKEGPFLTKPWMGVEDAPKERLLPDVPTPGPGVL